MAGVEAPIAEGTNLMLPGPILAPQHPHSHPVSPLTGLKCGDSSRLGRYVLPAALCPAPRPNVEIHAGQLLDQRGVGVRVPGRRGPVPPVGGGVRDPHSSQWEVGSRGPFLTVRGQGELWGPVHSS